VIYKFKRWVAIPLVTEVYIVANSDEEAVNAINKLDPKTLSYTECPMSPIRSTYEIVKENDPSTRTKII
tara:strand:+ start:171 stop:377 length:207 start_codon:yes stop_codon:yes gene_type:complete